MTGRESVRPPSLTIAEHRPRRQHRRLDPDPRCLARPNDLRDEVFCEGPRRLRGAGDPGRPRRPDPVLDAQVEVRGTPPAGAGLLRRTVALPAHRPMDQMTCLPLRAPRGGDSRRVVAHRGLG